MRRHQRRRGTKRKVTTALVDVEGAAQQGLIQRYCREGMTVQLLPESDGAGAAVWIEYRTLSDCGAGRIGVLPTGLLARLGLSLDELEQARATIKDITRGKMAGPARGVILHVEVG